MSSPAWPDEAGSRALTAANLEVRKHLSASASSARRAMAVLSQHRKSADPVVRRRVLGMLGRLKGALSLLEDMGSMQPGWDTSDPDLMPEAFKQAPVRAPRPVAVPVGEDDI